MLSTNCLTWCSVAGLVSGEYRTIQHCVNPPISNINHSLHWPYIANSLATSNFMHSLSPENFNENFTPNEINEVISFLGSNNESLFHT